MIFIITEKVSTEAGIAFLKGATPRIEAELQKLEDAGVVCILAMHSDGEYIGGAMGVLFDDGVYSVPFGGDATALSPKEIGQFFQNGVECIRANKQIKDEGES